MWADRAAVFLAALLWIAGVGGAAVQAQAVEPAVSIVVDWPGDGAVVPSQAVVLGWAIAGGSARSTGLDGVRAYLNGPADSGAPLGRAAYGLTRPDVALARGEGRYAPSGWRLEAELPPGSHVLYLYAHLADQPEDEGWVGPVQVAVQVAGGAPSTGSGPRDSTAASGSGACSEREQAAGRCSGAPGPATADCLVPDRMSGRCLVRPPSASRGTAPGTGAIPGSWTVGAGAGGSPAASPAGSPTAPSSAAPASLAPAAAAGSASASAAQDATTAGMRAPTPTMSLTAVPIAGRQVQLSWNQVQGGPVSYEIRRCPAASSGILACGVVASVQSGSYRVLQADGVYVVRAVGPEGQPHGESNRVHVCCGGAPTLWP
jgi:hypothetical protein